MHVQVYDVFIHVLQTSHTWLLCRSGVLAQHPPVLCDVGIDALAAQLRMEVEDAEIKQAGGVPHMPSFCFLMDPIAAFIKSRLQRKGWSPENPKRLAT